MFLDWGVTYLPGLFRRPPNVSLQLTSARVSRLGCAHGELLPTPTGEPHIEPAACT
jgi:hypothetical protein